MTTGTYDELAAGEYSWARQASGIEPVFQPVDGVHQRTGVTHGRDATLDVVAASLNAAERAIAKVVHHAQICLDISQVRVHVDQARQYGLATYINYLGALRKCRAIRRQHLMNPLSLRNDGNGPDLTIDRVEYAATLQN